MGFEGDAAIERARAKGYTIRRIMEEFGHHPGNLGGNWKHIGRCPFCSGGSKGKKATSGVFVGGGGFEVFKCHHDDCPTGGRVLDEIGYLLEASPQLGSRKEAFLAYLDQAGERKKERQSPSVMPGQRPRKTAPPEYSEFSNPPSEDLRGDKRDSGTGRVSENPDNHTPTDSTQNGPGDGAAPQGADAGSEEAGPTASPGSPEHTSAIPSSDDTASGESAPLNLDDDGLIAKAIDLVRSEGKASVPVLKSGLGVGSSRATRLLDELEARGVVGPARANAPREVIPEAGSDDILVEAIGLVRLEQKASVKMLSEHFRIDEDTSVKLMLHLERSGVIVRSEDDSWSVVPPEEGGNYGPQEGVVRGKDASGSGGKIVPADFGGGDEPPVKKSGRGDDHGKPRSEDALRWFWERITLEKFHEEQLWEKRGLHPDTARLLGLRSSVLANKDVLEKMPKEFPPAVLVRSGLFNYKADGRSIKPSGKYFGYDKDGEMTRPVLIPYLTDDGEIHQIRPHRDFIAAHDPRLHVVRLADPTWDDPWKGSTPKRLVITEGEFKAHAVWQVLGNEYVCVSVPGIHQTRRRGGGALIMDELDGLIEEFGFSEVVIAYDAEERGDPKLPGYKNEEWKRYPEQIEARYLAADLSHEHGSREMQIRICVLPREWYDEAGKADLDGAGAKLVRDLKISREDFVKRRDEIAKPFLQVLEDSPMAKEIAKSGLFSPKAEKAIFSGVRKAQRISKVPASGTNTEKLWAKRIRRFLQSRNGSLEKCQRTFFDGLLREYSKLSEVEVYYTYHKLQSNPAKAEKSRKEHYLENWQQRRREYSEASDWEAVSMCNLALQGTPKVISDFVIEPRFQVHCEQPGKPPKVSRLVVVKNEHGEYSQPIDLESKDIAGPKDLRVALGGYILCSFEAGERELQAITSDLNATLAHKKVNAVPVVGWHEPSRMWFFHDAAIGHVDGRLVEVSPNKDGIFKLPGGERYWLTGRDFEGEPFAQQPFRMHPGVKASDRIPVDDSVKGEELREARAVQSLFQDFSDGMFNSLGGEDGGGYEAYLLIGAMLAYFAQPEIYEEYSAFPGVWVHGESREGKSTMMRWLMAMMGFTSDKGIAIKSGTRVGMQIALGQYSSVPVWFEEAQHAINDEILEVIKNSFNREGGVKFTGGKNRREIRTAPCVTGVATAKDSQVKSRFPHVQVSKSRRRGENRYEWFQSRMDDFFLIGRFILRRRPEFVGRMMRLLREWEKLADLRSVDDRARMVYGVSYAAYVAAFGVINGLREDDQVVTSVAAGMQRHQIRACFDAAEVVQEQLDVEQFLRDVIAGFQCGDYGTTLREWRRYFKVQKLDEVHPPDADESTIALHDELARRRKPWVNCRLYFTSRPVIRKVEEITARTRREARISDVDLRAQMSRRDWWVPGSFGNGNHKQRFVVGNTEAVTTCWCIDVTRCEMGYAAPGREELEAYIDELNNARGVSAISDHGDMDPEAHCSDPRKGELFTIIDAILAEEEKANGGVLAT